MSTVIAPIAHRVLSTFRERLLIGLSWNVLSAVILQGAVLVSAMLVARFLGAKEYGIYAVMASTALTIAGIAQGGSGLVATKFVAEFSAASAERVASVIGFCRIATAATGGIASIALYIGAESLSRSWFERPELAEPIQLISVSVFFYVTSTFQHGALLGFGAFKRVAQVSVLSGFAQLIFSVGGTAWGLRGALLGLVVASACRSMLFSIALHRECRQRSIPVRLSMSRDDLQLAWSFALPATLAGFITLPSLWLVILLISRQPEGLTLVALFSATHQIRQTILQFPLLLNSVSFSVFSKLKGSRDETSARNVFLVNMTVAAVFSIAAILLITAVPHWVLSLYGSQFISGALLLTVLIASVLPETLELTSYQLVQSSGQMWRSLFVIIIPRDITYLVAAYVLVLEVGIVGAAVAYLVSRVMGLGLTVWVGLPYWRTRFGATATDRRQLAPPLKD